jgi:hypothetical protein
MEAVIIIVATAAIATAAYSPAIGGELSKTPPDRDLLGFLILLPLMWAILRGDQRDSATVALVFCGLAAWGLSVGTEALPAAKLNRSLLFVLALSTSTSLGSLILGAAIASHDETRAHFAVSTGPVEVSARTDKIGVQKRQTALSALH